MRISAKSVDRKTETYKVLSLLARGIHPVDGSALHDEGCWNHPVVIRALLFAGDCLLDIDTVESKKEFARSGKPWLQDEDSELRAGFEKRETLQHLSNRHKRSSGAIIARIAHLGLASDRDEARKIFASNSCSAEVDMMNE